MSEAVSALEGATFEGFCTLRDAGPVGMVTIRGDLGAKGFAKAVKDATGCGLPHPRGIVTAGGRRLAWMSPDELLLICEHGEAPALAAGLAEALKGQHALALDVSDARAMLRLEGAGCREVIAKLSPANLAPGAFGPGEMRRTRLAQVAGAFYMPDETSFEIFVFRSVARYAFDLIANAARPGSEVGLFAPAP
ncbi:sarcosine oxidase subunit gamma [Maritimibacter sp. HL-12]|uniref:sarcosine oxidase subunit gamma n=1 Tax=Maritimibacter sp. HL-12 TaxID=1162418 RepID=UPI000A0F1E54|nr:sarcosine oxidase subunit gamma family protein [Maritimibacter sp. HL-12]SMH30654.1 sarcosine oxidase subunit gamma [Maritimibacter sp. HL-12]